jgi:hypothetical protein
MQIMTPEISSFVHEAPMSATNSQDDEMILIKEGSALINNNAASMPTILTESINFDHKGNPSLQKEYSKELANPSSLKLYDLEKKNEDLDSDFKHAVNFSSQYFDAELQNICDELEKTR